MARGLSNACFVLCLAFLEDPLHCSPSALARWRFCLGEPWYQPALSCLRTRTGRTGALAFDEAVGDDGLTPRGPRSSDSQASQLQTLLPLLSIGGPPDDYPPLSAFSRSALPGSPAGRRSTVPGEIDGLGGPRDQHGSAYPSAAARNGRGGRRIPRSADRRGARSPLRRAARLRGAPGAPWREPACSTRARPGPPPTSLVAGQRVVGTSPTRAPALGPRVARVAPKRGAGCSAARAAAAPCTSAVPPRPAGAGRRGSGAPSWPRPPRRPRARGRRVNLARNSPTCGRRR